MLKSSKHRGYYPTPVEEEDDSPEEKSLESTERGSGVSLKLWSTLAVIVAGCGFAGSKEPWAMGLVAFLIALNLIIAPPRTQVPRSLIWPLVMFALLALGSFLPVASSALPRWRQTVEKDFGIMLGGLRTPQPWVSVEEWVYLAIALIWLWHCLGRGFNESERRWLIRMLSLMVTVLAALAVWFKRAAIDVSFWQHQEWKLVYFGPFPNRNNFGGLLAMGAVLTFAAIYDSFRRRSRWWLLQTLCLLPILGAMVSNTSRAGLALFFLGLMAWMIFASFSKRSAQRMGVAAALVVVLVAFVILFGQHILGKFELMSYDTAVSQEARFHVWGDCATLIRMAPMLGSGLGCFAEVFPFHQTYYDAIARYIHPESDWLWLAAEIGVPAVVFLMVGLVVYVRRTGVWRSSTGQKNRKDRRLRNACVVAALILPLESIVDTAAHQIGLVCLAGLLAGLSLHARRSSGGTSHFKAPRRRMVFAGFCLFAASAWFSIAAGHPFFLGNSSAKAFDREYDLMREKGDLMHAKAALSRELVMKPLHYYNYYERASLSLARGLPPNNALEDFARMRFLEPHMSWICHQEALVWQKYHPAYAPAAWREAMRRDTARADFYYDWALAALRDHPEIRSSVRILAQTPRQKLRYLTYCNSEEFNEALNELLELHPTLENFSPEERLKLFSLWFSVGNRSQLIAKLEGDATWRVDGWPVLAQCRAAADDFRGAYQLALEHLPPPAESASTRKSDVAQLRREFLFHPTDFNYGFALFEAEKAKGLINDALVTLDKVAQIPNAPPRVYYEQAVLLSRKGDSAAAWEKMKTYLDKWQVSSPDAPATTKAASSTERTKEEVTKLLKRTSETQK